MTDVLTTFIKEIYKPAESFRLEVYKIVGGSDALVNYNDEEIFEKLKELVAVEQEAVDYFNDGGGDEEDSMVENTKNKNRDMTQWALDNIS